MATGRCIIWRAWDWIILGFNPKTRRSRPAAYSGKYWRNACKANDRSFLYVSLLHVNCPLADPSQIGSSLGALTILHALLYLSSRTNLKTPLPQIVDSAFLISLPSAPSTEEWASCRQVVARRLVNGWCEKDLVLAGIVR